MRRGVAALSLAIALGSIGYATYRGASSGRAPVVPNPSPALSEPAPVATLRPASRSITASRVPARHHTAADIGAHVRTASLRHGVPESLVAAVISVESQFNPRAISHRGALGLMQLMPATAAVLGVRDAFDPRQNVDAGARHLRDLMNRFDDLPLVLAAYNAGPQAVIDHGGVPPYPETRAFVARVMGRLERGVATPAVFTSRTPRRIVRVAARLTPDGMQSERLEPELVLAPMAVAARDGERKPDIAPPVREARPALAAPPSGAFPSAPSRVEAP